jgi:methylamine dehydrogenase accessory protein MauD
MELTTVLLISHVLLWVVVLVQVVLTLALARLVGRMLSRQFAGGGARVIDPGPDLGAVVEGWEATDLLGRPFPFRLPRRRGLFLLYVSPHCSVCAGLVPAARRFFKEIAGQAEGVWVLVLGSREAQIAYARENGLTDQPVLAEGDLPPAWRLGGAPFGLWVDAAGRVKAKGMVDRREHLESLRHAAETGYPTFERYVSDVAERQERQREGEAAPQAAAAPTPAE